MPKYARQITGMPKLTVNGDTFEWDDRLRGYISRNDKRTEILAQAKLQASLATGGVPEAREPLMPGVNVISGLLSAVMAAENGNIDSALAEQLSTALREYHEDQAQQQRLSPLRNAAQEMECVRDGELEIDDNATVSEGEDDGAYIQAWLWVSGDRLSDEDQQALALGDYHASNAA